MEKATPTTPRRGYRGGQKPARHPELCDFRPHTSPVFRPLALKPCYQSSKRLLLLMKAAVWRVSNCAHRSPRSARRANAGDVALGHYVSHPFNIEAAGDRARSSPPSTVPVPGTCQAYIEPQTVFALADGGYAENLCRQKTVASTPRAAWLPASDSNPLGAVRMRCRRPPTVTPFVVSVVSKGKHGTDMGFLSRIGRSAPMKPQR